MIILALHLIIKSRAPTVLLILHFQLSITMNFPHLQLEKPEKEIRIRRVRRVEAYSAPAIEAFRVVYIRVSKKCTKKLRISSFQVEIY